MEPRIHAMALSHLDQEEDFLYSCLGNSDPAGISTTSTEVGEVGVRVGRAEGRPWNVTPLLEEESIGGGVVFEEGGATTGFAEGVGVSLALPGRCRTRAGGKVRPDAACGSVEQLVGVSSAAERVVRTQCGFEGSLRSRLRYS